MVLHNAQKITPPEVKRGRKESEKSREIAELLRKEPGEWFLVAEGEKNDGLAVRIRNGGSPSFRGSLFEARSHKEEDGTVTIYARFIRRLKEEDAD